MIALEIASTIGTVAAAGLAVRSIRQSKEQSRANAEAIVRERRVDFFLDRLLELMESAEKGQHVAFADQTVRLSLRTLPAGMLPLTRATYDEGATDGGLKQKEALLKGRIRGTNERDWLRDAIRDEITAQVQVLLDERGTTVSNRLARRSARTLWLVKR